VQEAQAPPAISSRPSGERSAMLSIDVSDSPKYSSKSGPTSLSLTKTKPR
jgi:hypothetical protein